MTDPVAAVRDAFERDSDFESTTEGYRITSSPFTVLARFEPGESDTIEFVAEARLPSLEAAVADESISDALLEGWAEPMERRLADVEQATALSGVRVECRWDRQEFVATFRFRRPATAPAPTDELRALAGYVEGTYLQGTIPGYSYRAPVDDLLETARERAGVEDGP